jgi:hypothetical protein
MNTKSSDFFQMELPRLVDPKHSLVRLSCFYSSLIRKALLVQGLAFIAGISFSRNPTFVCPQALAKNIQPLPNTLQ